MFRREYVLPFEIHEGNALNLEPPRSQWECAVQLFRIGRHLYAPNLDDAAAVVGRGNPAPIDSDRNSRRERLCIPRRKGNTEEDADTERADEREDFPSPFTRYLPHPVAPPHTSPEFRGSFP